MPSTGVFRYLEEEDEEGTPIDLKLYKRIEGEMCFDFQVIGRMLNVSTDVWPT